MKTLLGYIGKERHADSLVEKLMLRFEAAVQPDQWKNLAYCLTQVRQKKLKDNKAFSHRLSYTVLSSLHGVRRGEDFRRLSQWLQTACTSAQLSICAGLQITFEVLRMGCISVHSGRTFLTI